VESIMATVNTVSHGRAHHGGGGEKRSLHVGISMPTQKE
jgi:hypothetical protein